MPIIQIKNNSELSKEEIRSLQKDVVSIVSRTLNKPEDDIQVLYFRTDIWMANSDQSAACIDIRFVSGLNNEIATHLCERLGTLLQKVIDIDLSRLYINFFDIPQEHAWRFKNGTPVCPPKKK